MSDLSFWAMIYAGCAFTLTVWAYIGLMALNRMKAPEREPAIDYDQLQRALDEEFAPIRKRERA